MYQEQRLNKMLELLQEQKELSAKEMVDYFQVSKDTIRRDFALLSQRQLVQRTHGGILPLAASSQIPAFNDRLHAFTAEKKKIASLARQFLRPQQLCFFDVSTIVLQLAQLTDQELTVYSHSLDNAIMMSQKPKLDFHLMGGKFYPRNRFYYDISQAQSLQNLNFDIAFIGAAGLNEGQISFEDEADKELKKRVLKQAKVKVLLAEQDKCLKSSKYILGSLADVDYWICDRKPAPDFLKHIPKTLQLIYE